MVVNPVDYSDKIEGWTVGSNSGSSRVLTATTAIGTVVKLRAEYVVSTSPHIIEKARAAGREAVRRYGVAMERLADGT